MITSLMVLPGIQSGNSEWFEEYITASGILDMQLTDAKWNIMMTTHFCMPVGKTAERYRAGW